MLGPSIDVLLAEKRRAGRDCTKVSAVDPGIKPLRAIAFHADRNIVCFHQIAVTRKSLFDWYRVKAVDRGHRDLPERGMPFDGLMPVMMLKNN